MDTRLYLCLLLACLSFQECSSVRWASGPENNAVVYACAHGTLSLPWAVLLNAGDVIESVQWFFSGRSEEMIATEAHGHFFTMPAFSGRATKTTNVGISVDHMQVLDSGNYSVEVIIRQASGDVATLWRSADVHVTDDLQTTDGGLHVSQMPVAEYDNQTDQYHVVLGCGTFTYPTQPPFQATWLTPSGHSAASSGYHDNQFFFLVPNPVDGGTYTCKVSSPSACLHGNSSGDASIAVNKLEARLAVLEARQMALESRNAQLESKNTALEIKNTALEAKDAAMENEIRVLSNRVDIHNRTVSFHARLSTTQQDLPLSSALKFDLVVTNVGNAYDPSTGHFVAPYAGTYFFISSSEDKDTVRYAKMALMANNNEVDLVETRGTLDYQAGSVHGVVSLSKGQAAWVEVRVIPSNNVFEGGYTAFSGFLIHAST